MHEQLAALLAEIEEFRRITGMSASYFGKLAAGDSTVCKRLARGGMVHPKKADRIRDFIKTRMAGMQANT